MIIAHKELTKQRGAALVLAVFLVLAFIPATSAYTATIFTSNTSDGRMERVANNVTFADLRTGAGTNANTNANYSYARIMADVNTSTYLAMYRGVLWFNTSVLPADATITSAKIGIFVYDTDVFLGDTGIGITKFNGSSIDFPHYQEFNDDRFAADINISTMNNTLNHYQNFTLNPLGRSNISLTGYSKFGVRTGFDIDNITPGWGNKLSSQITYTTADNVTYPPFIEISYTNQTGTLAPVAGFTSNVNAGNAPLAVQFTDTSLNTPTSWIWNATNVTGNNVPFTFNSTSATPLHTFGVGNWSIKLNATNSAGSNITPGTYFINVSARVVTAGMDKIGVVRDSHTWYLDLNDNGAWDGTPTDKMMGLGRPGDMMVTGDWNGDNTTEIGVVRDSHTWYLDMNNSGGYDSGDKIMGLGRPGDIMVTGDWNGDKITEIGVVRDSHTWYLDMNNNGAWDGTPPDIIMGLGRPGDIMVTGDWNADNITEIGVVRDSHTWYLDMNNNGAWDGTPTDQIMGLGRPGDFMVTGKWL